MVTLHLLVARCSRQCAGDGVSNDVVSAAAATTTTLVPSVAMTPSVGRPIRHRPDWTAAAWVAARPRDIMIGLVTTAACSVTPS